MLKSLLVHISASDLHPSVSNVPQTGLQALGGNRERLNRKESLRRRRVGCLESESVAELDSMVAGQAIKKRCAFCVSAEEANYADHRRAKGRRP